MACGWYEALSIGFNEAHDRLRKMELYGVVVSRWKDDSECEFGCCARSRVQFNRICNKTSRWTNLRWYIHKFHCVLHFQYCEYELFEKSNSWIDAFQGTLATFCRYRYPQCVYAIIRMWSEIELKHLWSTCSVISQSYIAKHVLLLVNKHSWMQCVHIATPLHCKARVEHKFPVMFDKVNMPHEM